MAKILVIEDYPSINLAIEQWLCRDRHQVEIVDNGTQGLDHLRLYKYDMVILDKKLPGLSGLDVLREYRLRGGTTPIIMLSAESSAEDKETGLDGGADDYLVKPVEPKELSARIRALLRRASLQTSNILKLGQLTVDMHTHQVFRDGQQIHLTPTELSLLEFFFRHPNQVFTAEALLERVWRSGAPISLDTVRSYIRMLREKIDPQGGTSIITTVHGAGYMLHVVNHQS